jgi:hypothetical protein
MRTWDERCQGMMVGMVAAIHVLMMWFRVPWCPADVAQTLFWRSGRPTDAQSLT